MTWYCHYQGHIFPAVAEGAGRGNSHNGSVRTLVPPKQGRQKKAELDKALSDIVTTMHTIITSRKVGWERTHFDVYSAIGGMPHWFLTGYQLFSQTFFNRISLGSPGQAEKAIGISTAMASESGETPTRDLLCSFGGETLDIVCQATVNLVCGNHDITAKFQVQKGAPVQFLLESDLLPWLGFSFLESQTEDAAVDHFHHERKTTTHSYTTRAICAWQGAYSSPDHCNQIASPTHEDFEGTSGETWLPSHHERSGSGARWWVACHNTNTIICQFAYPQGINQYN